MRTSLDPQEKVYKGEAVDEDLSKAARHSGLDEKAALVAPDADTQPERAWSSGPWTQLFELQSALPGKQHQDLYWAGTIVSASMLYYAAKNTLDDALILSPELVAATISVGPILWGFVLLASFGSRKEVQEWRWPFLKEPLPVVASHAMIGFCCAVVPVYHTIEAVLR